MSNSISPSLYNILQINVDGTAVDKEEAEQLKQLMEVKFVDMNLSVRLLKKLEAMGIKTIGDLLYRPNNDITEFGRNRYELEDLLEALNLNWGDRNK